ncbi:hypothetical protein [Nocardioides sp.]|uniref:hypothetical protein n=1 Tax=Nocardioides sp. TaxID=35761 RepID=UPI002ED7B1DD
MAEDTPRIAPPPSVDDVLSALTDASRIGQVDFGAGVDTGPKARRTVRRSAPAPSVETKSALRRVPTPMAAPITEPRTQPDVTDAPESTAPPAEPPAAPPVATEPEPAAEPTPEPTPEPAPEPTSGPPAPEASQVRRPRSAPKPLTVVGERPDEVEPRPQQQTTRRRPAPRTPAPPVDVARAVEELAAGVMGRIHAAERAALRHLEAMELEAARRYELVTAQAELDAELIRLQSRREAHAIVTAARMRAGELDDYEDPGDIGHRLAVLSDAISRVADTTDATLARSRDRERDREGGSSR